MLVTQKLTECRIKNATFERRKQREREGAEKDTRLQGRRTVVGGGVWGVSERECGVCGRQGGKEQRAESREKTHASTHRTKQMSRDTKQ